LEQYRFGHCRFDASSRSLRCGQIEVTVRGKVAELLLILLERPGDVFANETLREQLWPEGIVETGNLAQQAYLLRKALAIDPTVSIENVARVGYRLRAAIPNDEARSKAALPPPSPPQRVRRRMRFHTLIEAALAAVAAAALLVLPSDAKLAFPPVPAGIAQGSDAYQLGRYFWARRGNDNLSRAKMYFQRAVSEAPKGARGYAGLAEVWGVLADDAPPGSHERAVRAEVARSNAEAALARDPESAEGHAALGLALDELNVPVARSSAEYRRAIELDPRNVDAREWYAIELLLGGNLAAANEQFDAAAAIQPENVAVASWHACVHYLLRDGDKAVAEYRTVLEINPSYAPAQLGLMLSLVERGRDREAQLELGTFHSTNYATQRQFRALAAIIDLRMGRRIDARTETRRLRSDERSHPLGDPDDDLVVAAFALDGQREEARRLRSHMQFAYDQWRRVIQLDPIVGPVYRQLGDSG
jgi:DNA-binding winged helix-turn-helix (wHTH) protein/Tfp pilus assembly protein PilF